jgi:hypothetical protein
MLSSTIPLLVSWLIVVRHAQIIELSFNISKQNDYALGILGLSLPLISVFLKKDISIELIGYFLVSLLYFELVLLKPKGVKLSVWSKIFTVVVWICLFLLQRKIFPISHSLGDNFSYVLYLIFSGIIFVELYRTASSTPSFTSDRYDLYMLAYFSVAGVLFNYCSENIAQNKIQGLGITNISTSEVVLLVFWLVVLVRIIQSLHLAALDYQDTQLKGLDLFILSIFYIFITIYWILEPNNPYLYGLLFVLASIASGYFLYMRFSRIYNETAINLDSDKRIQTVNSVVFAIIAVSNGYMFIHGHSNVLMLLQIAVLLFNMYHSYRLTMWVKFDLLHRKGNHGVYFVPIKETDLPKVASILNRNFGYIYEYYFRTFGCNKQTLRSIFLLLSSGSRYGNFGMSHFFWIYEKNNDEQVGLICLKAISNVSYFYSTLNALIFFIKYFIAMGSSHGMKGLISFVKNRKYLEQLDLCDTESLEIAYLVINNNKRRMGFTKNVMSALRETNIESKILYPRKKLDLKNISLIVRESNENAITAFKRSSFLKVKEINNLEFDNTVKKGSALVMQSQMVGLRCN